MQNQNPTFLSFFIAIWFLLLSIMFLGVKSQEQTPGLLCISECGTCPAICSPPPAPEVALKPPPSPSPLPRPPLPHSTPPEPSSSVFPPPGAIITPINPPMPSSPSPPLHNYPNPPSFPYYFLPPLSPPLLSPPSRQATPPPSPPSHTTPPPPSNNFNIPASVAPPAGFGQKNFSYPYYYFYVSEAASRTLFGPILAALLISFYVFYSR